MTPKRCNVLFVHAMNIELTLHVGTIHTKRGKYVCNIDVYGNNDTKRNINLQCKCRLIPPWF